ncbi:tRNA pseudouridine(55) synthase TruB [Fervidibacillus halotolerans]|uniref:tRNA pseudouridine synthase B n=1 Tax=Fervidibacillus halotolerans TaxID=2980027 RepID=A0A9E8RZ55_9BACI|nr:tRNA pseudouridine(55) synthase TruB [Fervidibacillus halotolerans]WAA13561.1 tRNA pseudouridine(55) synthase TruB [Fervidibacillus halotolerans]
MNGILPLWKPSGYSSHDCVVKLRRLLGIKKIGHTGTLDPSVTGVLPIAIGEATKVVQFIQNENKSYEGTVTIGISTTTEDADGEIVEQKSITKPFRRGDIVKVFHRLTGEIIQVPPMYSAVKVNGKRLYEYAREGKTVERPKRKVKIFELELLDDLDTFEGDPVHINFRVKCSKGTYIRTLAVMIGDMLGYPAHMSKLVRIESAGITAKNSLTFEEIEQLVARRKIEEAIIPIEQVLNRLPKYEIHDKLATRVKNGAVIQAPEFLLSSNGPIAITNHEKMIALYQLHPNKNGFIKPIRVLNLDNEMKDR